MPRPRAAPTSAAHRQLELLPIGCGAAYGRADETQSSYLVRGAGRSVLLDLGAGSLNRLVRVQPPETLDLIVISHVHPDHVADLLSLRVYMAWGPGRGRRVSVLAPAALRDRLVAFSGDEGWADGLDFGGIPDAGADLTVGGLRLTLRPVPHHVTTFAVRVDDGTTSLCYTADCQPSEALEELAAGCDILLAECSFGAGDVPEGVPHLNAAAAGRLARDAGVGRLALTHIFPEYDPGEAVAAAAEVFPGPIEWARSGSPIRAAPPR